MRLLAKTRNTTKVTDMANNMGEAINTIPKGEQITLNQYHKNSGTGYYYCIEYSGWVRADSITIQRDVEFLYTSNLARAKVRSASNAINTTTTNSSNSTFKEVDKYTGLTDLAKYILKAKSGSLQSNSNNGIMLMDVDSSGNDKVSTDDIAPSLTNSGMLVTNKENLIKGSAMEKFGAGVLSHYMENDAVTNIANQFIQGSLTESTVTNTSINGLLQTDSTSVVGQLLTGATIGNISDGSFFKNSLKSGKASIIANLYKMLMTKLNYVVGKLFGSKWGWLLKLIDDVFLDKSVYNWVKKNIGYNNTLVYSPITPDMIKYFRYKGCNYEMITRTFDSYWRWEQDKYYSTPTLTPKKIDEEVKFYRSMYNDTYTDFKDAIEVARDSMNLNIDREDWFKNFNRYRLIVPDGSFDGAIGHLFFTRPDFNLANSNGSVALSPLAPLFYNMLSQHSVLANSLTKGYSSYHDFIPYLGNRALSIDIPDEQIKTREVGETLTGFKIAYAFHNIESVSANTVTITFGEDDQVSTYLYFKLWTEYMSGVARGLIKPHRKYIKSKQLDYAISIYYFLTKADGESILYWTKFTGAFPTNVPSSAFSMREGERVRNPTQSITWQYSEKRDYNPLHLAEFNNLSHTGYRYVKTYNPESMRAAYTLQGAPFVDTNTGGRLFKLRFRTAIV